MQSTEESRELQESQELQESHDPQKRGRVAGRRTARGDMTAALAEGKILPLIVRLSVPAVVAQLITFLYNIVDRMYVARIADVGMDALAALGGAHGSGCSVAAPFPQKSACGIFGVPFQAKWSRGSCQTFLGLYRFFFSCVWS